MIMYESTRDSITKYYSLSGLNNINLVFHNSAGWKSEMWVLIWLDSSEGPLCGLQMADFSLGLHMVG